MNNSLKLDCKAGRIRLFILFLFVLPLAGWATTQLYLIFKPNSIRPLEWVQLIFASMLFLWLSVAFWTAIIGMILNLLNIDPLTFKRYQPAKLDKTVLKSNHAVIMPVYNEDTARIMAGFESTVLDLTAQAQGNKFDFYMLSDTQRQTLIEPERIAWQKMLARLPEHVRGRCFYRRREKNTERKVGNLKSFFKQWAYRYLGVVVLDADSMMSGSKIVEMSTRLELNPKVGLIQTIPMPVRQQTFFARFVQFAAHVYSPMLATGLNFWQGNAANYWGHNAAIRVDAFIDSCGLPPLKGRKPFGGDILSHDFVEAALLRRNGWDVFLLLDDSGSYEEVPSNIIDYATRDRRWVQGNMQHLALLGAKKLTLTNRLHFLFGAFAYASSICLVIILFAGTADAVLKVFEEPVYFPKLYQLFPEWVITPRTLMITTLYVTIALLFVPKIAGLLVAMLKRVSSFGGLLTFCKGALFEFVFAVLIAPIMLMFHSYFVLNVLAGKSVAWEAQTREGKMVSWLSATKIGWLPSLLGILWTALVLALVPSLFLWLLPVLLGLVFTIPIIRYSSSLGLGKKCQKWGIFVIAPEIERPDCISVVDEATGKTEQSEATVDASPLPPVRNIDMPTQDFFNLPLQSDKETENA